MMRLLILYKIRATFRELAQPSALSLTILGVILAILYGLGTAFFIINADKMQLEPSIIIKNIYLTVFFITLWAAVFPNYQPLRLFFPLYLPMSAWQRYRISVALDTISTFHLLLVIYFFTSSILLGVNGVLLFVNGLGIILLAFLSRRLTQYILDFKLHINGITAVLLGVIITLASLYFILWRQLYDPLLIWTFLPFLFTLGFLAEQNIQEKESATGRVTSKKSWSIYLQLLLANRQVRVALGFALGLKLFMLGLLLFSYLQQKKSLLSEQFVYWLFASPLIIYTYVFNNTWGFFKKLWLTLEITTGDYKIMVQESLKLQIIPVIIDAVLTIPIFLLLVEDKLFFILFYGASFIILAAISIIWSLLLPMVVQASVLRRNNTAFVGSLISIVMIFLLTAMQLSPWFYLLVPAILLAALLIYKNANVLYQKHKHQMAQKLLKE